MSVSVKTFLSNNQTCSTKCRSKLHQNLCFSALTQNVADEEFVKTFLLTTCQNFWRTVDGAGRNLVHWAASCGKTNVLEWLLENFNVDVNAKDTESGYTPLHRAFFFGQISCAQVLLKHDAATKSLDFEGLTPIDILQKNSAVSHFSLNDPTEIYAAGENVCYNLGFAIPVHKMCHEPVDFFCRQSICIKQVAMSNFHTVFLATDGRLFTCGHGSGGRLGHGDENAQVLPRQVQGLPGCRGAAVGNSHTIVVTDDGDAYSWGDNSKGLLGLGLGCTKELSPKQILLPKNFRGISNFIGCAACSTFSVLWGSEDLVCTFGQNTGQMGQVKSDPTVIPYPKQISVMATKNVDHVICCEVATVLIAKKGDIYLLQDYEARKLTSRLLDLKSAQVVAGSDNRGVRLLLLTTGGKLLQCGDGDPEPKRTVFTGIPKLIYPVQMSATNNCVLLVSPDGHCFSGTFTSHVPIRAKSKPSVLQTPTLPSSKTSPKKVKDNKESKGGKGFAFKETGHFLEWSECYQIAATQLPNIHRALWSVISPNGQNSFIVQQHTSAHLTELPMIDVSDMLKDYERLLNEADLNDSIHDIVVSCGGRSFPGHKFVLASRSSYFARNMSTGLDKILITNMDPLVFEQCLKYIYTDDCDVLKVPWKGFQNWKLPTKSVKDPLSLVVQAAKQLGIEGLSKRLEVIGWNITKMETKFESRRKVITPKFRLDKNAFPELQDASLVCSDGVELGCHQCILCARVNYFRCMFSSTWASNAKQCHSINVDSITALNLLNYIYRDDLPSGKDQTWSGSAPDDDPLNPYCKLMVIADEWLLDRLRQMCEMKLCDLISLRNVCELLEFAQVCNADQLKKSCLQFACLNMPAIVESNSLNLLSESSLSALDRFYKQMHPAVMARSIRPYTTLVTSEDLELAYVMLQSMGVTVEECVEEVLRQSADADLARQHKAKKKSQTKRPIDLTISDQTNVALHEESLQSRVSHDDEDSSSMQFIQIKKPTDLVTPPQKARLFHEELPQSQSSFKIEKIPSKKNVAKCNDVETTPLTTDNKSLSIESRSKNRPRITPWSFNRSKSDDGETEAEHAVLVSLKEVMEMEEKASAAEIKMKAAKLQPTSPVSSSSKKVPQINATGAWNRHRTISCSPEESYLPIPPPTVTISESLSKIILDEEKSLMHRREVLNKPLKLIQLEELALQQLLVAYNADNNFDELITAERYFVDPVAEPSWQAHCGSPPGKY